MRRGIIILACLVTVVGGGPGCSLGRRLTVAQALQSESPSDRIEGAVAAAKAKDEQAVPLLVELLDDPSADVRFAAAEALRRITGETLGYNYYADPAQRSEAIERWRQRLGSRHGGGDPKREESPLGAPTPGRGGRS